VRRLVTKSSNAQGAYAFKDLKPVVSRRYSPMGVPGGATIGFAAINFAGSLKLLNPMNELGIER
jgi:hypothetical protein